ncbi:MAG: hypothetical protein KJ697_02785 [Nanoarchaeota archaeon]|nr:hypothetical protein [Nanoarchaeota archaeon]MBU4124557.1 hypothetical protein [Nanoarchaeota archaeon]
MKISKRNRKNWDFHIKARAILAVYTVVMLIVFLGLDYEIKLSNVLIIIVPFLIILIYLGFKFLEEAKKK